MFPYFLILLTSDGSQSGYDPRAGRRGRALTSLVLPLVHTGGRLHCDFMFETWKRPEETGNT